MWFNVNKWNILNKPLKKPSPWATAETDQQFPKDRLILVCLGFFVCEFIASPDYNLGTTELNTWMWCFPVLCEAQGLGRERDRPAKSWHSGGGHRWAGATTDFCCQNLEKFTSGCWRNISALWGWQSNEKRKNQHNKYCTEGNMPVVKGYE